MMNIKAWNLWLKLKIKSLLRIPDVVDYIGEPVLYHPKRDKEVKIVQTKTMIIIHDADTPLDEIIKDFNETIADDEVREMTDTIRHEETEAK